jgi:hypothetical protein
VLSGTLLDSGSTYNDNNGVRGGAVVVSSTTTTIQDGTFVDNSASDVGGGVSIVGGSDLWLERLVMWGNVADVDGGALVITDHSDEDSVVRNLYMQDNIAGDNGGGISITGTVSRLLIANTTLVANTCGGEGGGISVDVEDAEGLYVWSNILMWNDGDSGLFNLSGNGASIAYNTGYASTSGVNFDVDSGEDAGENETADPLFGEFSNNGDPTDDDLTLSSGSPAIDSGPTSGGPSSVSTWSDTDWSRNDRGADGGPGGGW